MPDSLRVLFVNPGADVYGSDLQMLESIRALVRSGHEVLLLAADAGPLLDAASAAGAEVRVTPFPVIRRSYLSVAGVSRLTSQVATRFPLMLRYVRGARCDLVYVNTMTIPWWVLAARLAGVPVLCHVHEAEDADALWLRRGMTAPLFLADRVVLNSRTAAGVAHEVCPSLHASSTVVLNGMPDRPQRCVPPPPGERPRLALVGRLSERKSQHVAVAAVDVLRNRGVDVDLELAGTVYTGNEAYERRLRTMVLDLGLEERVRFSGYVAPSSTVFDRADIALSLSERESLGNVVLEAQLAGRPVIATRTGGHMETIEDGCTRLHVPLGGPPTLAPAGPAASPAAAAVPTATEAVAEPPPPTVTADALPSWQINGVVWSQAIVGDTVFVTGSFTRARPPGVAPGGAGEVAANNIFAYSLSTGNRVASFAPSLNAQGLVIRASLDGTRLYVGGDFTAVNGLARGHVVALNASDGSVVGSFAPNVGGQVRGIGVTTSTVYVGGNFMSANGVSRTRLAAFSTANGAMTSWAPRAEGGYVWTMTMSPDRSRVIPGGSFTTLSGTPAYGMGSVNAADATVNPWPAQEKIRTAGANGAITSLKSDGTQVYGTSYAFGAGAAYEGTFAIDPTTGQINWQNDCLGDTYDIAAAGPVLYNVSHQHDCTVVGGWPDTDPRVRWQKARASYSYATDIQTKDDAYGWASSYGLLGLPYAKLVHWYPNFAFGSYPNGRQAGLAVDTSSDGPWVVVGGEFPRVNNVAQQGITRFRMKAGAPNKVGPSYSTVPATPTPTTSAVSLSAGEVRVSFGSAWDYDDETLKYEVLRNNNTWVHTQTAKSNFWTLPRLGFVDKGLTPGTSVRYQVRITDAAGNVLWSPVSPTVTVGTGAPSAYAASVRDDGAEHLWRLGESSGATVLDHAGFDDATLSGGDTRGRMGANR